ncbi:VOC family protein [Chloroflexi bacterium TSY]|nr:VOC family protein [Chloroflexi bacterium TSY]
MKLTATHHVGLFTPNFAEMEKFCKQTLGLEEVKRWEDPTIVFLAAGNTVIELINSKNFEIDENRPAGFDHFAFHVDSVDTVFAELVEAGITIDSEPRDFKDVRIAFFRDPDGNLLELVEEK